MLPPQDNSGTRGAEIDTCWTNPYNGVRIYMPLEIVRQLSGEALQAMRAGKEVGGLLWGGMPRNGNGWLQIESAQLISCAGPHFNIQSADLSALVQPIKSGTKRDDFELIGYFRSHIEEGLFLRQQDEKVIQQHMREAAMVFIVIRPFEIGICMAGLFFWNGQRLQADASDLEIPFLAPTPCERTEGVPGGDGDESDGVCHETITRRGNLPTAGNSDNSDVPLVERSSPASERRGAPVTTMRGYPVRETALLTRPAGAYLRPIASAAGFLAVVGAAFLVLAGVVIGLGRFEDGRRVGPDTRSGATRMGLQGAQVSSRQLNIQWNGGNPLFRNHTGRFTIRDGLKSHAIALNNAQLRSGRLVYLFEGSDLQLRLDVFLEEGYSVSESLWIATRPPSELRPVN